MLFYCTYDRICNYFICERYDKFITIKLNKNTRVDYFKAPELHDSTLHSVSIQYP